MSKQRLIHAFKFVLDGEVVGGAEVLEPNDTSHPMYEKTVYEWLEWVQERNGMGRRVVVEYDDSYPPPFRHQPEPR